MASSTPNVALVVLDTLRKDAFDDYFGWLNGTTYVNAWSTTHYSPAAHGSLFTGRFGSEIGVHAKSPNLDSEQPTLAEILQRSGYTTRGFSANTYVSKYFNFDRGFEDFQSKTRVVNGEESTFNWPKFIKEHKTEGISKYIKLIRQIRSSDARTFPTVKQGMKIKLEDLGLIENDGNYQDGRKAIDYFKNANISANSEFLFVNIMDAHAPYVAPPDYRTVEPTDVPAMDLILSDEPTNVSSREVKMAYEDCVKYLSDVYEDFHEQLREEFDYVITIADHGEAFGEYGSWKHNGLVPQVTNIPLSIHTPEDGRNLSSTDQPVNLHDVFQTVLDLANVEAPEGTRGSSLLDDAAQGERLKLLESHGMSNEKLDGLKHRGYGEETLDQYDQPLRAIASETGYAFETNDGTVEHIGEKIPDAKSKMESLASDLERREDAADVDISAEVHDRLEELGYT